MPINNERFVGRSWTRNCDYLNFDFEDSVPQAQKEHSRTLVRDAIVSGHKGGAEINLRINCSYPEADTSAALLPGMERINHPKAETAAQVQRLDALITRYERQRGLRPGSVAIGTAIETTLGTSNSYEIASASPRIESFAGGTGYDMSMDMGVEMFVAFDQFVYNRGEGELVAIALGLERDGSVYLPDTTGNVATIWDSTVMWPWPWGIESAVTLTVPSGSTLTVALEIAPPLGFRLRSSRGRILER